MAKRKNKPVFTGLEKTSVSSLSCIFFFRMFGLFLVIPIFSLLALDLEGATPMLIGFAFGGYALTQAVLQIPFGIWSDHIGRKPVIAFGLVLFILGSAMGAFVDNIYWMIVARLLQGAGAISSAVFALIADLTRPEVRARANAGLGASIGLAFGTAFLAAPFLGHWIGLSGIFALITAMASISLIILFVWVPTPEKTTPSAETWSMIKTVLHMPVLLKIDFGAFVCTMGLSATFFITPLVLFEHGFEKSDLWKIYLPMLLLGGITMVLAAIFAETKNRFREVMISGAGILLLSFFLSWTGRELNYFPLYIGALFFFFMGFNVFEPIFPSLLTRMTTPDTKGTASGIYSFSHYMGNFAGAVLAGLFYHNYPSFLFLFLIGTASLFFYLTLTFPNPEKKAAPEEGQGNIAVNQSLS
ncbi:MAG: MFS transporter [SAR324 cluster bacterium]|nr:MFS transporter [SAR324 cluster bacterium]